MTQRALVAYLLIAMGGACADPAPHGADAAADATAADARAADARAIDADELDGGPALGCLGTTPPATAPDPIDVHGQVFDVVDYQVAALAGATVELHAGGSGAVIASSTTGADGRFAMSVATGGAAVDGWLVVIASGRARTDAFPAAPLTGDEDAFLLTASVAELGRWYRDVGATYAAGARTAIVAVKDCDGASPSAVTATATPAAAVLAYYDPSGPAWSPSATDAANGFALVAGAPASVTITPRIGAQALPARTLAPAADALTLVLMSPRAP